MISDLQLSTLNQLYWFKDLITDKENTVLYMSTLKRLAIDLEAEGLVKEIEDYLLILKENAY